MAIVTPHQSQAGIATANAGQAAPYRSASAFMTPGQSAMPSGLNQLARGVDKLGDALFRAGLDRMKMQNATDLLADKVAYEDALRQFDSDYRKNHLGASARDAEEAYAAFHQEQYDKLKEKWGGNPFLMEGVDRMAEGIRLPSMQKAVNYRDGQEEAYKKSVLQSSQAQTFALLGDPNISQEEKDSALDAEERNLRMFAGQKPVMVNGRLEWQGGRDVGAEIMALRQKASAVNVQGFLAMKDPAGAQVALDMASGALGSLAMAHESGGDPGAISRDTGGSKSYGLFQFNNMGGKGTANSFVAALKTTHPALYEALGGGKHAVGSEEFDKAFEQAASGPLRQEMVKAQQEHLEGEYLRPIMDRLKGSELASAFGDNPAMREVMLSTAIQHGPGNANRILREAWGEVDKNADRQTQLEQFIMATYKLRGRPGEFRTALAEKKDDAERARFLGGMRGRYEKEAAQALGMARGGALPPAERARFQAQIDTMQKKQDVDGFLATTTNMPAAERLAALEATYGKDPAKREIYDAIRQGIFQDDRAKEAERTMMERDALRANIQKMVQIADLPPAQSFQAMRQLREETPLDKRAEFDRIANNLRNPGRNDDPLAIDEITQRQLDGEEFDIRAEYGSRLTPATVQKLQSKAYREALPSIMTTFDATADEWLGVEKNKEFAKKIGAGTRAALKALFLSQTDADEKKDAPRLRREAEDFFKRILLEKPGVIWNSDMETIQGFVPRIISNHPNVRPKQGTPEYGNVTDALKAANIPPDGMWGGYTDEQLSTGYRLLREQRKEGA